MNPGTPRPNHAHHPRQSDATRRLSLQQDRLARLLGPLDAAEIPGGCTTCDAFTTYHPLSPGVWIIRVHHDSWCPQQRGREARRAS